MCFVGRIMFMKVQEALVYYQSLILKKNGLNGKPLAIPDVRV